MMANLNIPLLDHHVRSAYREMMDSTQGGIEAARTRLEYVLTHLGSLERLGNRMLDVLLRRLQACLANLRLGNLTRAHTLLRDLHYRMLIPAPVSRGIFRVDEENNGEAAMKDVDVDAAEEEAEVATLVPPPNSPTHHNNNWAIEATA
jgi:hypothetical protein